MRAHRFNTFEDFWPYYIAMHSRTATRWLHLLGTTTGALLSAVAVASGSWVFLPALPVLGYGAAWPAHWAVERNNPATFGHPFWSLRGDLRMISSMLRGGDRSLAQIAKQWLEAHPEDRSPGSSVPTPPPQPTGAR
jgi:hypothetical protein